MCLVVGILNGDFLAILGVVNHLTMWVHKRKCQFASFHTFDHDDDDDDDDDDGDDDDDYYFVGIRGAGKPKQRSTGTDQQATGRNQATGVHVRFSQLC